VDSTISKKVKDLYSEYDSLEIKKGETLIYAYKNPKETIFLMEGLVKMYAISKNGNEFVLNIFKAPSFFPISLIVNKSENHYYYEAMTKVKIKKAPNEKVLRFIKSNPDVLYDLLQRVYRGMDGILLKLEYSMSSSAKSRLIVELITQAKRFGKKNGNKYELSVSLSELSTTVGLARETVSREIKILKEKKLITLKNKKLVISDLLKLVEEIN
jgi:CRP-like cAMP-binding protein